MNCTRRSFLKGGLATLFFSGMPLPGLGNSKKKKNIIVIMLRGGMDGLTAVPVISDPSLNKLRKKRNKIPVIILTANNNFDTKIKNLNIGADDFLTKPFKHEELVARIHAILRRPKELNESIFQKGNIKFNNNTGELLINNKEVKISKKAVLLFEILSNKFSKTVTKSEIEDKLYDHDKEISSNPIEVTLFRLRKNLEKNKSNLIINNLKGIGYRLVNAK